MAELGFEFGSLTSESMCLINHYTKSSQKKKNKNCHEIFFLSVLLSFCVLNGTMRLITAGQIKELVAMSVKCLLGEPMTCTAP